MKLRIPILVSFIITVSCLSVNAQNSGSSGRLLPNVSVKTLTGENFAFNKLENGGKPIVVDFWATWCKPCIEELNAIHENYEEWKQETGVKVVAISLDDARTMNRVAPMVNGRGWDFEVYIDPNSDLKRSMNVNMPPHTFVVNGKGEIVWQHVGYSEGNELELLEVIKKVAAGESVSDAK
jgi:alkyl hydroperoxide reductase subunit AhpC